MKIKVSKATNTQLNWLVAKCEGGYDLHLVSTYGDKKAWQYTMMDDEDPKRMDRSYLADTDYCGDWAQGGPIIERESISVVCAVGDGIWSAYPSDEQPARQIANGKSGPTPLIAAMRCLVVSKLGDEVEVPDELV